MSGRDVIVVGAGAAGVSAALWAKTLDLDCALLERGPEPGGQLHHVHFHPPDLAGLVPGDGPAIAREFARQLAERGIVPHLHAAAVSLQPSSDSRPAAVDLADGGRLEASAILIASGCRRRRLDVPGAERFLGRGISLSATRDRAALVGRRVVVVGGGDAAFENALLVANDGGEVTVVVRGEPRAREEFRARAASAGVRVLLRHRVCAVHGDDALSEVELEGESGRERVRVDALVVKIGVEPNTGWCASAGILDPAGYVITGRDQSTAAAGVWAAGDVTRPALASLAVALGQGAQAMAAIRQALRPA